MSLAEKLQQICEAPIDPNKMDACADCGTTTRISYYDDEGVQIPMCIHCLVKRVKESYIGTMQELSNKMNIPLEKIINLDFPMDSSIIIFASGADIAITRTPNPIKNISCYTVTVVTIPDNHYMVRPITMPPDTFLDIFDLVDVLLSELFPDNTITFQKADIEEYYKDRINSAQTDI